MLVRADIRDEEGVVHPLGNGSGLIKSISGRKGVMVLLKEFPEIE